MPSTDWRENTGDHYWLTFIDDPAAPEPDDEDDGDDADLENEWARDEATGW